MVEPLSDTLMIGLLVNLGSSGVREPETVFPSTSEDPKQKQIMKFQNKWRLRLLDKLLLKYSPFDRIISATYPANQQGPFWVLEGFHLFSMETKL